MELTGASGGRAAPRTLSWPFIIIIAVLMHVDWHFARPHHHRWSLQWEDHWIFAMVFFGAAGRWAASRWRGARLTVPLLNIAIALLLAQGVEPLLENAWYNHQFGFGIDADRWNAFFLSVIVGIPSFLLLYRLMWQRFQPRKPPRSAASAP